MTDRVSIRDINDSISIGLGESNPQGGYNFTPQIRFEFGRKSKKNPTLAVGDCSPVKELPEKGTAYKFFFKKKSKLMIFFTKFIIFVVFTGVFLIKFPHNS